MLGIYKDAAKPDENKWKHCCGARQSAHVDEVHYKSDLLQSPSSCNKGKTCMKIPLLTAALRPFKEWIDPCGKWNLDTKAFLSSNQGAPDYDK